ncbi:MAG: hypothetical protein BWK80_12070 [Desulfobacteraceae bacterium IS3]|nr:MAG: hypothetical protein BWK80_12070 [Desulfobacteraceae bacterium IS3]
MIKTEQTDFCIKVSVFLIAGVALLFYGAGLSASQIDVKIKDFKKEAAEISREIKENKAEIQDCAEKENKIINHLDSIERELSKAEKQAVLIRSQAASLEAKIKEAETASEDLKKQIQIGEKYASRRMVALYKLNRMGEMQLLASADSVSDFFQRKTALKRILEYDSDTLGNLSEKKAAFQKLSDSLREQKKEKLLLESACKKEIGNISSKKKERSKLLSEVRSRKSLKLASVTSLQQAANDLDKKIKELLKELLKRKQREGVRTGKFAGYKGVLNLPVKGEIVSFFGPYRNTEFNVMNFQSGIDIKATRGEAVHAVCEGEVIFSDWFKGYGNMIIIDHGNHYCTLYAHLDKVFKKQGDHAEKGEVIATVGETGSTEGPRLHFELRHHGKSVDPLRWLRKG